MHDLDRTMMEFEDDEESYEGFEPEYYQEAEYDEMEAESPFDEAEEMELASQLLEITDEAELDQFLGKLFKKASRAAGRFMKSGVGRKLGGILKGVAKKALPVVGGALGSIVAPGVGTAIGSSLGSMAGRMFGLELEGLSPEDQEFEVAKRFVRLAGAAAKNAALLPATAPVSTIARKALVSAAHRHAPGVLRRVTGAVPLTGVGHSGRWVRRGRKIVLFGV